EIKKVQANQRAAAVEEQERIERMKDDEQARRAFQDQLARQQEEIREEYYSGLKGLWRRKRGKEPPELATLPTVEQLMEKRRARIEAEKKKGKNGRKNSVSRSGRKQSVFDDLRKSLGLT
ncbi:hypothetical protein FOZ62_028714, partial [Perkinsus olseni]